MSLTKTLGLHFGHDAAVCELSEDGEIRFKSKERETRVKHAWGLSISDFESELAETETATATTTQYAPGLLAKENEDFEFISEEIKIEECVEDEKYLTSKSRKLTREETQWVKRNSPYFTFRIDERRFPTASLTEQGSQIYSQRDLNRIALVDSQFFSKQQYRMPARLILKKRSHELNFIPHHFAHASYGFYSSPFKRALIISYDGGIGSTWDAGGFFLATIGEGIAPLIPGSFWFGKFYDGVASCLALDAGKLMGLAPYGKSIYDDTDITGSLAYLTSQIDLTPIYKDKRFTLVNYWLERFFSAEEINQLKNWNRDCEFPPILQSDIAASAQHIIERNILLVVKRGLALVKQHKFEIDGIVLVGGVALNCPANAAVSRSVDVPIWIPPACNDEGLAIGSAVYSMFGKTKNWLKANSSSSQAFLGASFNKDDQERIFKSRLRKLEIKNVYQEAAKMLHNGKIGGTFFGKSEVGPRALGNRSIVASPLIRENWSKVNRAKNREMWRPLAPIVLESHFNKYFDGASNQSLFMLLTHRVISNEIPAVTHRDYSARAQCCTEESEHMSLLLKSFAMETNHPLLLNTSFNSRAVPIVESPSDALEEFFKLDLDFLISDSGLYVKENV